MTDWYDEHIEPGIRSQVRLLRDNGFNTLSSCEHRMQIDCEFSPDGEVQRLHNLLWDNGYKNYLLEFRVEVMNGCPPLCSILLHFPGAEPGHTNLGCHQSHHFPKGAVDGTDYSWS